MNRERKRRSLNMDTLERYNKVTKFGESIMVILINFGNNKLQKQKSGYKKYRTLRKFKSYKVKSSRVMGCCPIND